MNKNSLKEYLSFSKKERNGLLVLVILIVIIFLLPYFLPTPNKPFDKELVAALQKQGSASGDENERPVMTRKAFPPYRKSDYPLSSGKISFFYFDPNTIDAVGWSRLGVKPRTAETIGKYLARGGKFRQPEDLKKIFGFPAALADRLTSFVRIRAPEVRKGQLNTELHYNSEHSERKSAEIRKVDINTADSAQLVELNGIGPTLASRILKFRDKLGGFYELKQLGEVYGLRDSSFQALVPSLTMSEVTVRKLNINEADLATLSGHPYIGRKLGAVIVTYRQQHGNFASLNDLLSVGIVTPDMLKKISPYLVIGE